MPSPQIVLFDDESWKQLLPLTYTRPVSQLRVGPTTLSEIWSSRLGGSCCSFSMDYLRPKFPFHLKEQNLFINSSLLPSKELINAIQALSLEEALTKDGKLLAFFYEHDQEKEFSFIQRNERKEIEFSRAIDCINELWDLFLFNEKLLRSEIPILGGIKSAGIPGTANQLIGDDLYLGDKVEISGSIINTTTGPVFIDDKATILEGCLIRGPFYLGKGAVLKMGTKIYGPVSIGPKAKMGGEIGQSIVQGYSNKGHDGYLGHSYIGAWCNLGADTNNSNLKNNYSQVKLWSYAKEDFQNSGQQFCGLFMGDHSKTAIGSRFNTGTVIGVCSNVFTSDFPPKFIPSFAWGLDDTYQIQKAFTTAETVMKRRNIEFSDADQQILNEVFTRSAAFRHWERKRT